MDTTKCEQIERMKKAILELDVNNLRVYIMNFFDETDGDNEDIFLQACDIVNMEIPSSEFVNINSKINKACGIKSEGEFTPSEALVLIPYDQLTEEELKTYHSAD